MNKIGNKIAFAQKDKGQQRKQNFLYEFVCFECCINSLFFSADGMGCSDGQHS